MEQRRRTEASRRPANQRTTNPRQGYHTYPRQRQPGMTTMGNMGNRGNMAAGQRIPVNQYQVNQTTKYAPAQYYTDVVQSPGHAGVRQGGYSRVDPRNTDVEPTTSQELVQQTRGYSRNGYRTTNVAQSPRQEVIQQASYTHGFRPPASHSGRRSTPENVSFFSNHSLNFFNSVYVTCIS